jgi:DNA polymerase III alpha subunit (gram-positive type)
VQLSAVCGDATFNKFVTPTQPMTSGAEDVTGILYNSTANEMTQHGVPVQHKHAMNVLLDFIDFLKSLGKCIVLVAHNCRSFDSIILHNQLKLCNIWNYFCKFVTGFCDSLPYFRLLYPTLTNHKQKTVAVEMFGEEYVAHDAMEDCKMLQNLVEKSSKENMLFEKFFFSVSQVSSHGVEYLSTSIDYLCDKKVLSKTCSYISYF